jgi:allantoin racemase
MKILLINPNLLQDVTDALASAARRVAAPGTEILAVTGTFGAEVIGSRAENALAAHGVLDLAARHAVGCDAVVLGVSLDSGLQALRELLDVPVVGMTQAGLHAASLVASRIALLTFGVRMVPLYEELVHSHGFTPRVVRVDALPYGPKDVFSNPTWVREATLEHCRRLVEADGAEAIVLAGAAFAALGRGLQSDVPVPLVDGIEAAVPLAEMLVRLNWRKAKAGSLTQPGARASSGLSPHLAALLAGKAKP